MRSLFSGVSGLKNHQTRMDVIGNNIANVNTTGFKGSRVTFQDILSQTVTAASSAQGDLGGINAKQIGLGMGVASIDTNTADGSVQSTGYNTDLCISGNGYFVLGDGDTSYYTRNGAFSFDSSGNYVNSGGLKVQGWMADSTGTISSTGEVTDISVPVGQTMAATATTTATYTKNLTADGTTTTTYTTAALTTAGLGLSSSSTGNALTDYNAITSLASGGTYTLTSDTTKSVSYDGTTYTVTTNGETAVSSFSAYDSLGVKHTITGTFTKSTTADNTWSFSAGSTTDTGYAISGTISDIVFGTDGKVTSGGTGSTITFTPDGAAAVSIALDFSSLTQYSGDTTVTVDKDGNAAGSLSSVSIDSTGTIVGTFSNGLKQDLAQVALATFNNPGGLTKSGTSLYSVSNNSGDAQISTAGTGGAGTLTPSSLEMSNVDLSEEFSNMIITQRGFQANSKIITTSDEMLETLVGLKR